MPDVPYNINNAITEFLIGTKKMFGNRAKKIILYGSYARGDYNNSSDIDIMILTDFTDEEIIEYGEKIWDFAYDIELKNNILISPLIKNINKFNSWLDILPFYANVQKEGVVLNEQ